MRISRAALFPLLLLGLGLGYLHPLWRGTGIVYSPHSDVIALFVGAKSVFQKALWSEGRLPLWNPAANCGTPAQANPVAMYTFPLHWPYFFLPVDRATNLAVLLGVLGAGLAMYLLCLRLLERRVSAFFCAAGYMLCHRSLSMIDAGWLAPMSMYALAPLLFWSQDRLVERPDRRRVCELAVVYGLCLMQGFSQGFYYALIASSLFLGERLYRKAAASRPKILAALAAAGFIGLLLSAPDMLPRLEFVSLSTRLNFSYDFFIRYAPSWPDLRTLLDPRAAGGPEFWEKNFYLGLWLYPPCLFACWKSGRANRALIAACAALFLICFDSPALRLAYAVLPGFKLFRLHSRILMLEQLTALVLAGKGLDAALREGKSGRSPREFALAWAVVALFGFLAAAAWKSPSLAATAAGLALAAVLIAAAKRLAPAHVALLALLPVVDGGFRLMPATVPLSDIFPDQAIYQPIKRQALNGRVAAVGRKTIPYGAAGYLDLDMANGMEGLNLKSFEDYFAVLKYGSAADIPRLPVVWTDLEAIAKPEMLRALDIETIASGGPLPLERIGFEPAGRADAVPVFDFYKGMTIAPVRLWRDTRPLGAAYFAAKISTVATEAESLAAVAAAESVRTANVLGLDRAAGSLDFSGGTARLVRRGYDDYLYRIASRGENFLILSQIWYPGWRARLDGRDIPLYRTNHALIGCFVPPGDHALDLRMTSPKLRLGVCLFALGAALIAALLLKPKALPLA